MRRWVVAFYRYNVLPAGDKGWLVDFLDALLSQGYRSQPPNVSAGEDGKIQQAVQYIHAAEAYLFVSVRLLIALPGWMSKLLRGNKAKSSLYKAYNLGGIYSGEQTGTRKI